MRGGDAVSGRRYHLYRYHRFDDVRLAFLPEEAVATFGGDADNFNFPRYALDTSLLRVYEDGKPAQLSAFFPLKAEGVKEGEATFVLGHPEPDPARPHGGAAWVFCATWR